MDRKNWVSRSFWFVSVLWAMPDLVPASRLYYVKMVHQYILRFPYRSPPQTGVAQEYFSAQQGVLTCRTATDFARALNLPFICHLVAARSLNLRRFFLISDPFVLLGNAKLNIGRLIEDMDLESRTSRHLG
jgi:hypothetical protein